jgi:hypothetical protein
MPMQLKPFGLVRRHTAPGGEPLSVVPLVAAQHPPAEYLELRVGPGFANVGQVVDALNAIAAGLQSNSGFRPDMVEVRRP